MEKKQKDVLPEIYQRLFKEFGPQHWWPGETPFEVMVGAILTQNTNWGNVEKAIKNLKQQRSLSARALKNISSDRLASLIRPAGYFNVKAKRLKNFIDFFWREYDGDINRMIKESLWVLRPKLLSVNGIGPETADSILLYALDKPIFVIDAYTKRFVYRHNLTFHDADYASLQKFFMSSLREDTALFNEYHALIVHLGKDFCRTKALCERCPLKEISYSLIHKCSHCHRALPLASERRLFKKNLQKTYLCQGCYSLRER